MKYLKTFESYTEPTPEEIEESKKKIDEMSHEELASMWRFGHLDNKLLQGEVGQYFKDRLFNHFGGFNPTLSKSLGWEKK